jgi:uncharacterized protein YabN with tetrapyrrole methylase and pyrophosphatase domain
VYRIYFAGEDAKQIQDKLDAIKERFSDLSSQSAENLSMMEDALPMALKFHEAHNKLQDWMMVAEPRLKEKETSKQEQAIQVGKIDTLLTSPFGLLLCKAIQI